MSVSDVCECQCCDV
uniref:Uncharacterized protein n=1 Tax=Anguilla anguilla TaxID=7936 RepID=A0A0E9V2C7_ANGAN